MDKGALIVVRNVDAFGVEVAPRALSASQQKAYPKAYPWSRGEPAPEV